MEFFTQAVNVFFSFVVSDLFYQINSILQNTRTISYWRIMIRKTCLI